MPYSIWTAKRFAFCYPPQRFLELISASNHSEVAEALLTHFFPLRAPPPRLLSLSLHEDYTPLTLKEIFRALACSSNTSAPGPVHISYSV